MTYETNQSILSAIREVERWVHTEGTSPKPAAIAQEIVRIGKDIGGTKQRALLAAFGLLAGGLEINPHNIAWLIQDGYVGYPTAPTFDI
ncbi:hypothetical protein [Eoetvoesiella caeni]|jgi:hypothetical protein|uniref:Uncharacterized protein n=1 Tax=Eoetvoesiella caeni TaxID=645616 RepID=A0A366HMB0_9BURK|nr:hypothetical protein [Eoetvoesiella caeni]MCI2807235.1 hypothetical protein [Eoetvoesiella caeni]NYT53369.1 hypothetical protein [Eoetvoesiella caeni]RBP43351.1 hypothetical protein DFR37_101482 [Eoetvoesiella caeni]